MKKIYLSALIFCSALSASAQRTPKPAVPDTVRQLQTVTVKGYLSEQPALSVPASVGVLSAAQLRIQPDNSFVTALNTLPGVRAEERSPGSYRLSVRGSLLRSPFGVRDVKIYFDEIPLTDAGGNTYLNAIDISNIRHVELLKGPDGSLFGANSGGVMILSAANRLDSNYLSAGINGGSYGLLHQRLSMQKAVGNHRFNFNQSYQTDDGYRENSRMHRTYLQAGDAWQYNTNSQLRAMALYSDLDYQTPGGLNLAQMQVNPRAARLATPTLPSAIDQKIRINTKQLLGGLVNDAALTKGVRNVLAIFGSHVDFANPFITNYEQRNENTYGLRSYFEFAGRTSENFDGKLNVGVEWQQTNSLISNFNNNKGIKGDTQKIDKINTNQHFFFARYASNIYKRLHAEAALSVNYYSYKFQNQYPLAEAGFNERDFSAQLMPRLALSYQITNDFIWRASVSRGYSTPTIAEVRPTNNIVNTGLKAQYGWNYETGFRLRNRDESLLLDASVFYYRISNAIVRQLNQDETEYYTNAGGTKQPGFELSFTDWLLKRNTTHFIRGLQFNTSVSISRFNFRDYDVAGNNYSANRLTGVPREVVVSSLQVLVPQGFTLFVQHNYTSKIPLNDANTVYANKYDLLQAKATWSHLIGRTCLEIYAGADNLLNEKYSLGNDLNAVGNRYYNPSPLRNYYAGIGITL